jgi:RNA polymerase sigma factor (TIGR02999 family)
MKDPAPITLLLDRLKGGDTQALDALIPLVYHELRRMASSYLKGERSNHTLQPTALVHEAYLRLAGQNHPDYQSRAHFFGVASQVMRQILVDSARRRKAAKRGGAEADSPLIELHGKPVSGFDLVTAVDDALKTLETQDKIKARLVEMRFFGGLTAEESAEVLQLPVQTVRRQLRVAQAWLQRELDTAPAPLPK